MEENRRPNWARYSSLGIELAAAIVGFALVGYWIDRHFQTQPWGLLICVLLGIVGGLYNLIRAALKASKEFSAPSNGKHTTTETETKTD